MIDLNGHLLHNTMTAQPLSHNALLLIRTYKCKLMFLLSFSSSSEPRIIIQILYISWKKCMKTVSWGTEQLINVVTITKGHSHVSLWGLLGPTLQLLDWAALIRKMTPHQYEQLCVSSHIYPLHSSMALSLSSWLSTSPPLCHITPSPSNPQHQHHHHYHSPRVFGSHTVGHVCAEDVT